MSRIHLRTNTLILWLSLSAAVAALAVAVGCSSDSGGGGAAGESNGSAGKSSGSAGKSNGGGGEDSMTDGGETGDAGGGEATSGGTGGVEGVAGGEPVGGGGEAGVVGEGGSAGEVTQDPNEAAKARALTLINSLGSERTCTKCHQISYSGSVFYPNITPDEETGIGSWTDAEIKAAITQGKGKGNVTLCDTMERFDFTDEQVADIIIYLKSKTPVKKTITGQCPP